MAPPDAVTRQLLDALDEATTKLEAIERARHEPIAIIGMSCRMPGADDLAAFWRLLSGGVDAIREVPCDRWDLDRYYDPSPDAPGTIYCRHGGFIEGVDLFDRQFFEIAPREAATLDPQQRLLLELTWHAFEHAHLPADRIAGTPTGVFVGITNHDYERVLRRQSGERQIDLYFSSGNTLNAAAGRIAYAFGLQGPAIAIDTACSSSLVAVHLACQALRSGECARAVVAGVNLILSPEGTIALSRGRMLAPDGRCKTFDAAADGYVRGEGAGVVILERLSDARAAGDVPLAIIRGSTVNQDGASGGFTVPSGLAQQALIRKALADAQLQPRDIAYVEAHGTGTPLGDPIEARALAAVFAAHKSDADPLLVGSLKTNVGHLESAAGVAALIKMVLALQHESLPPHLHFRTPSPYIDWATARLRVVGDGARWPSRPRRCGVSSFGASGTNAHVVLEEAPADPPTGSAADERPRVLLLSAKTAGALAAQIENTARFLDTTDECYADIAYTSAVGRTHLAHRVAVVAATAAESAAALRGSTREAAECAIRGRARPGQPPRLAMLFTGQGSQYAAMGRELYRSHACVRRVLDRCDDVLAPMHVSVVAAITGDSDGWRTGTAVTQPALFALQVALVELYASWGVRAEAVLGHSIGEYAAAYAAGILELDAALRLVEARGRLMAQLPADGAMIAVRAGADEALAGDVDPAGALAIAARNGPRHTVVAGPRDAVAALAERLERRGILSTPLAVAHAFHSPRMAPMIGEFSRLLEATTFHPPRVGFASTVTGAIEPAAVASPGYWSDQILKPVLFADAIAALLRDGCGAFLELGPQPVLTRMAAECAGGAAAVCTPSLRPGHDDTRSLMSSLATLHAHGVAVDWDAVDERPVRRKVALPSYPFQRKRCWVSADDHRPSAAGAPDAAGDDGVLLQRRLDLAATDDVRFEAVLRDDAPAFLRDHRVGGEVVCPAAAYVEIALEAAADIFGSDTIVLEDLVFERALVIPGDRAVTVQVVVSQPNANGGRDLAIHAAAAGAGERWQRHASGRMRRGVEGSRTAVAPAAGAGEALDVDAYYAESARRGIEFGPRFRALQSLAVLPELRSECSSRLPRDVPAGRFVCHPVLLDAAFQAVGAAARDRIASDGAFLPFSIDAVRVFRRPSIALTSRAAVDAATASDSRFAASMTLSDDGGVIAEIEGLCFAQPRSEARPLQPIASDPVFVVDWIEAAAPASAVAAGELCVILSDRGGVGAALSRRLAADGRPVRLIHRVADDANADADSLAAGVEHAIREAAASAVPLGDVVSLWALDVNDAAVESPESLAREHGQLCGAALGAVRAIVDVHGAGLLVVTRRSQPVAGAPSASGCVQSVLWGLSRTLALEHPDLRTRCLDLDAARAGEAADADAEHVADAMRGSGESAAAIRGGRRFVPRLHRAKPMRDRATPADAAPIRGDRSYVVTGGTGDLGLLAAEWLVRGGARSVVLAARRPPSPAAAERVRVLRRMAKVIAVECDVASPADVAAMLDRARAMAPIGGVLHAAGVLADAALVLQDWDAFARVFAAKVHGGWNLHRATLDDPLDWFVLYSSSAGVLGSPGQGNYAAANAFMDAVAWHRAASGRPALAVAWGAWRDVGLAARRGAVAVADASGLGTIDPTAGMAILEQLLARALPQATVVPFDVTALRRTLGDRTPSLLADLIAGANPSAAARAAANPATLEQLESLAPDDQLAALRAYAMATVAEVLGIGGDELDAWQPINTLGVDSLMAMELRARVKRDLRVDIPMVAFLGGASAADLAAQVHAALAGERHPRTASVAVSDAAPFVDPPAPAMEPARRLESVHPLTHGQRALWFLHQAAPDSAAYNTAFAVRIRSALDRSRLQRAWHALVVRHEALRTTVALRDEQPIQQVWSVGPTLLGCHDAARAGERELSAAVHAAYARPFDLPQGPLARLDLVSVGADDHVLLLTLHHIVGDAWSLWILMDELLQVYQAAGAGRASSLPAVRPYGDFVRWQSEMLASAAGDAMWNYWRTAIGRDLPTLELPSDRPRLPLPTFAGASLTFRFSEQATSRLRAFARRQGTTLYAVLIAAFQIQLRRLAGQDDVVLGSLTSGRTNPDFSGTVGYFVNPVVIRNTIAGDARFADVLARVRQQSLDSIAHQDFPFSLLVERLHPPRDPSRSPLFQVLFVLQKPQQSHSPVVIQQAGVAGGAAALRLEPFPFDQMEGQFDLTLEVTDGEPLTAVLRYNPDLFDAATVRRIAEHYALLLEQIVDHPDAPVDALSPLTADDVRLLAECNDTTVDLRTELVPDAIARQAAATPDAVALAVDGESWTYRELHRRATLLAARLRTLGVGPEVLVGVCMERSFELVVSLLAVLDAGGAYVPCDPEYPRERLEFMLRDSRVAMVLTHEGARDRVPAADCPVVIVGRDSLSDDGRGGELAGRPPLNVHADNLAYAIYTSGTTGGPKGALNTHRGLANRLAWMQRAYRLDGSDAVLQKTPFSFDVSVWEFFWPLMTGARLVLCRPGGHQDPSHLAALIREQSITTLHFVPSMLRVFLDQPALPALPSLRRVICSGEALSRDVERSFVERFDCELHNLYGPTEASIDVTAWRASRDDGHATVPLGRPIANTRIYVVDRSLRQCPVGVPGELCIAGVQVGRGYHRRPALTAERFVPDPFAADGTRMYRSGDRARWLADGVLEYLGRLDDQVKVRGVRIELGEIEARLRAHPRVREAAVVAAPAPGGGVRLIAYGVPSGAPSSDTEIRRFVHEALPETMVPSRFVWLDALPLSPNGKLDRKALPALDAERPRIDAEFTAPGSQTENAVAAIWREILDVPAVGVHDNFFELGGHSLMLARVHGRLVSRLSVTLTMVDLFRCPTVRLLAEAIDRSHAEPAPAAETSRADARQDRSMLLAARRGSRLQHRREVDR